MSIEIREIEFFNICVDEDVQSRPEWRIGT